MEHTRRDARAAMQSLVGFIGRSQLRAVEAACRGEERQFFYDKLCELARLMREMPHTYQQEGRGDEAVVYLHYFAGGRASWYITEKDKGDEEEPGQHQAFGLADLFGDGGEVGYISIVEILANGGELDFYFRPRTLKDVREGREPDPTFQQKFGLHGRAAADAAPNPAFEPTAPASPRVANEPSNPHLWA